jgi:CheY-like chemotaxis protein
MKTILIVEDNPMIHEKLIDILIMENYLTKHAGNGMIALDMMKEKLPDLIITDIVMPGITGFQLISKLKNDPRAKYIPIIILTAKVGEKYEKYAQEIGVFEYLTKPVSVQQ